MIDSLGALRLRALVDYRVADPLIVSAAECFGRGALCVILTGLLRDGARGVRAVKRHGGRTIVEHPATARAGDMPSAALSTGCVDLAVPLSHVPAALIALTMAPGAADLFRVPTPCWADLAA
jgi:two-component system chemotaxis response regulator CheB